MRSASYYYHFPCTFLLNLLKSPVRPCSTRSIGTHPSWSRSCAQRMNVVYSDARTTLRAFGIDRMTLYTWGMRRPQLRAWHSSSRGMGKWGEDTVSIVAAFGYCVLFALAPAMRCLWIRQRRLCQCLLCSTKLDCMNRKNTSIFMTRYLYISLLYPIQPHHPQHPNLSHPEPPPPSPPSPPHQHQHP